MLALLACLAFAGWQNREKIADWVEPDAPPVVEAAAAPAPVAPPAKAAAQSTTSKSRHADHCRAVDETACAGWHHLFTAREIGAAGYPEDVGSSAGEAGEAGEGHVRYYGRGGRPMDASKKRRRHRLDAYQRIGT